MALPPRHTKININNEQLTYIDYICKKANNILKENQNINLTFEGYDDLIDKFEKIQIGDSKNLYNLAVEASVWIDYLSSLKAIVYEELQNLETVKTATIAKASIAADVNKVANGDRLANMDKNVISIRRMRNTIEATNVFLSDKIAFLEKIYYLCKSGCDWSGNIASK